MDEYHLTDPESVRCLLAAAKHPSFASAARSVHLSPAAFGQRISRLEESLGTLLFHRSTRRVELTEAGARAVAAGQRLMDAEVEFRQSAQAPTKPAPYSLTIGTRFELGLSWLTPALSALASTAPERTLHLSFGDSADMLDRLRRETIDAAVTSTHVLPESFQFEVLHREEYVLVRKPGALRRVSLLAPDSVADESLLDLDGSLPLFDYFLRAQATSAPWQFRLVEQLGTIGAVRLRAIEGAGVAVLPSYFVAEDLAEGRLEVIDASIPMLSDTFRLVWNDAHRLQEPIRRLANELREHPIR